MQQTGYKNVDAERNSIAISKDIIWWHLQLTDDSDENAASQPKKARLKIWRLGHQNLQNKIYRTKIKNINLHTHISQQTETFVQTLINSKMMCSEKSQIM